MDKNSDKPIQTLDEAGCLGTKETTNATMEILQNEVIATSPQDAPPIVESAPHIVEPADLNIQNLKKDSKTTKILERQLLTVSHEV
ncbi:hypothetical protein ACH5RR_029320, partial [Cinchona calisaya]